MESAAFPFAVRLIGFSPAETLSLTALFSLAGPSGRDFSLRCLSPDNVQDPDLFVVNADEIKALAVLADCHPGDVRPALLIGDPGVDLPYPTLARPVQQDALFDAIGRLIARRADALTRLAAVNLVVVPERRRRERVDMDLTDPAEYEKMRRAPSRGGVLIVDKNIAFRDQVATMLARYHIDVSWAAGADAAVKICIQNPVAVVLINTSMSELDPYRLCVAIKNNNTVTKTAVVFLNGPDFAHDSVRAHEAGFDGVLDKPVLAPTLLAVLRKFMSIR